MLLTGHRHLSVVFLSRSPVRGELAMALFSVVVLAVLLFNVSGELITFSSNLDESSGNICPGREVLYNCVVYNSSSVTWSIYPIINSFNLFVGSSPGSIVNISQGVSIFFNSGDPLNTTLIISSNNVINSILITCETGDVSKALVYNKLPFTKPSILNLEHTSRNCLSIDLCYITIKWFLTTNVTSYEILCPNEECNDTSLSYDQDFAVVRVNTIRKLEVMFRANAECSFVYEMLDIPEGFLSNGTIVSTTSNISYGAVIGGVAAGFVVGCIIGICGVILSITIYKIKKKHSIKDVDDDGDYDKDGDYDEEGGNNE